MKQKPITANDIPAIWRFCLDCQDALEAAIENINKFDWNLYESSTHKIFYFYMSALFPWSKTKQGHDYWDKVANQELQVPEPKNFAPVNWEKLLEDSGFKRNALYNDLMSLTKGIITITSDNNFDDITMVAIKMPRTLSNLQKCLKFLEENGN